MLLKDKVVVVTGSTRGIGLGIAMKVAQEGGIPVVTGTNMELLEHVLPKQFSDLGYTQALFLKCDVRQESEVANVMSTAYEKYGRIDCVVANAGIYDLCPVVDMSGERWDSLVDINLRGAFLTDKYGIIYMLKNGGGKIVNISSDVGLRGCELQCSYTTSKFGIRGLTQSLAKEYARQNINVNCLCVGNVDTDMWTHVGKCLEDYNNRDSELFREETKESIPMGRFGTPEDIGNAAVMLLSDYANYITGASVPVSGGSSMN